MVQGKAERGTAEGIGFTKKWKWFTASSQGSHIPTRIWLKLDHSVEKHQIVLKESLDGISWRTVTILRKDQAFERNNLVISGTWHKGSGKEGVSCVQDE